MASSYLNHKLNIISFVSTKSGMGKTTLIESLISILKKRGYKVGALKHDAHKFEIDKKGKDSWKFANAGADNVILASSEKIAFIKKCEEEIKIENLVKLSEDMDILLMEGFKSSKYPKIEVHRKGIGKNFLFNNDQYDKNTFIGIATDEKVEGMENLDINDPEAIANFIEKRVVLNAKKEVKKYLGENVMKKVLNKDILKVHENEVSEICELSVCEYPLTLFLNGKNITTFLCTPENIKELCVGFLKTRGLIKEFKDIQSLDLDKDNSVIYVKATINENSNYFKQKIYLNASDHIECDSVESDFSLDYEKVYEYMEQNLNSSSVFKETGGVHSVALGDEKELIIICEDVARHNAMDKVIGYALMNGISFQDKAIVVSGRISLEMIAKAIKMQIPIVISKSAPTNLSIELAKKLNITLVGFVRGRRMNIYANHFRIKI